VWFCQRSRQSGRFELDDEYRVSCLEDGEHSRGTTEMQLATTVGEDVLVVASAGAKEVAEFVVASAEPRG
jgi:hypothetical protein